jgi:hypothetical protein
VVDGEARAETARVGSYPIPVELLSGAAAPDWKDRRAFAANAEVGPGRHQQAPLFERLAAPVGLLGRVTYSMGECRLGDGIGEVRLVADPVLDADPKP